jgi:hypothetical protein
MGKPKLDDDMTQELMRKKLCFSCRDPWVPGHRCLGKGQLHYIEVESGSEERMRISWHGQTVIQRTRPLWSQSSSRRNLRHWQGHSPRRRQNLVER